MSARGPQCYTDNRNNGNIHIIHDVCSIVHSYSIRGAILHRNGTVQELNVLNYIDGEKRINAWILTLDRLVDAKTLPTLTIANFQFIDTLNITNIALENVPVFVNTSAVDDIDITGNKIKSVPTNAFSGPGPSRLHLNNNEIESLAERSVNMRASTVILRCNKLSNFSQTCFENPGRMEFLDLSGNRIGHIPDRAFNQMINLHYLSLRYNHITSIGSEAFTAGIRNLNLAFTNITRLTVDMFAHRDTSMGTLYLHHNQLGYLPEALLLKLNPKDITLFGNPWQCQCLRDIEGWLRELNTARWDIPARSGEPMCVVPLSFQYVCIPVVDRELQQTYARGLSPLPECLTSQCKTCNITEGLRLVKLR